MTIRTVHRGDRLEQAFPIGFWQGVQRAAIGRHELEHVGSGAQTRLNVSGGPSTALGAGPATLVSAIVTFQA